MLADCFCDKYKQTPELACSDEQLKKIATHLGDRSGLGFFAENKKKPLQKVKDIVDRKVVVLTEPATDGKENHSAFGEVMVSEWFLVHLDGKGSPVWMHVSRLEPSSFLSCLRKFWTRECNALDSELQDLVGLKVTDCLFFEKYVICRNS